MRCGDGNTSIRRILLPLDLGFNVLYAFSTWLLGLCSIDAYQLQSRSQFVPYLPHRYT